MRILFINAYFYPEKIAFSHLESDIIEGLLQSGNEIYVVCPTPTRGITEEDYKSYKRRKKEVFNGVHITRFSAPRERKNPVIRALRYFWCNLREYQIGKRFHSIDVVFAVSTPPTQGLLAGKLARKLDVPFVYSLQDLFPDSLVTTGLTNDHSFLYRIGKFIERKTYDRCSKIIVISEAIRNSLLRKRVPDIKIETITNWVDVDEVYPVEKEKNMLFEEFSIPRNCFCIVYAGNFGASQGADIILKVAEMLKNNNDIRFVIFGGGNQFGDALEYVERQELNNIIIHPLLPLSRISEVYSLGNIALITCKKGVGNAGMPSKIWSIMACNTPIIASFDTDSELATILKMADAGICVEPENPRALADAIVWEYELWMAHENKNNKGRQYVLSCATKRRCVSRYVNCFESLIDN